MLVTLTPTRSVQQLKQFSSSSYPNKHLRSSLIQAKTYTDFVNQHLEKSKQEKYVLKTAARSYSNSRIHRIYSRQSSIKKTPKNQVIQQKKNEDPQIVQIVQALTEKTRYVPDIRQKLDQEMHEKVYLEQKIFELKRKILEERKIKDKIQLKNRKLVNDHQNSRKNTQILKEQIRGNLMLICILAEECSTLDAQLDQTQKINRKTSRKIAQYQNRVDQLQTQIKSTKIKVDQVSDQLNQVKHTQTIQYRKMKNASIIMNKLKQEKALLINHISSNLESHS